MDNLELKAFILDIQVRHRNSVSYGSSVDACNWMGPFLYTD